MKASALATVGSALSAVASSACCWLPLLSIGVGFSAAGAVAFFDHYRPWFLAIAVVLLGAGFFLNYRRDPTCEPGDDCPMPNPMLKRFSRAMLWVSTLFVVAFAFFPSYVDLLFGRSATALGSAQSEAVQVLAISGMTCEGCESAVELALQKVPGVLGVKARYAQGDAVLRIDPKAKPHARAIEAAIASIGYTAGEIKTAALDDAAVPAAAKGATTPAHVMEARAAALPLAGQWRAVFPDQELSEIVVILDVGRLDNGRWISQFDIPTIGLENYPVDVEIEGDRVTLEFSAIRSTVEARMSGDGSVLEGVARTGGEEEPARFERIADAPEFSDLFLKLEKAADDPDSVQPLSADGHELREVFNRDRDKVRLLMLLAPS